MHKASYNVKFTDIHFLVKVFDITRECEGIGELKGTSEDFFNNCVRSLTTPIEDISEMLHFRVGLKEYFDRKKYTIKKLEAAWKQL
jgi:hypothetical protein